MYIPGYCVHTGIIASDIYMSIPTLERTTMHIVSRHGDYKQTQAVEKRDNSLTLQIEKYEKQQQNKAEKREYEVGGEQQNTAQYKGVANTK